MEREQHPHEPEETGPALAATWAHLWALDPAYHHLNHGSFGACPRPILELQTRLRERLERDAWAFFVKDCERLLDGARGALAEFVGAAPDCIVFVANATAGVNTVLRSLALAPGDEILTTEHEYNACRNAADVIARQHRARVVAAPIPFPLASPDEVLESVLAHVTDRTRLALIDHVTSPTALVLPIERIVAALSGRGIDTLVDGAHGPGMLPLELDRLGAAYYTGNCHKWLCTPKGAALLYVRRDRQANLRPLVISHGANSPRQDRSRFLLEFDWTGTDDLTPCLCIPEAIRYLGGLFPGGWPDLRRRNRQLALAARRVLCKALGIAPPCPEDMIASMATVPLPTALTIPDPAENDDPFADPLQTWLRVRHRIIVPVMQWEQPPLRLLRISAQLYNEQQEYEALARTLRSLHPGPHPLA